MKAPAVTLRIRTTQALVERIRALSRDLDVTPADLIHSALENELSRQESLRREEQAALEALRGRILAGGQSVSFHLEQEDAEVELCPLCLREMPRGPRVDGPLLCEACFALARGRGTSAPGGS